MRTQRHALAEAQETARDFLDRAEDVCEALRKVLQPDATLVDAAKAFRTVNKRLPFKETSERASDAALSALLLPTK